MAVAGTTGGVNNADRRYLAVRCGTPSRLPRISRAAGIEYAKKGAVQVYLGRKPTFTREQLCRVIDLLPNMSDVAIGKQVGVDRLVVRRIQQNPAKAEAAITSWEMLKARLKRKRMAA
jgi:putative DNA-invertase from lambdoid prophage Rac